LRDQLYRSFDGHTVVLGRNHNALLLVLWEARVIVAQNSLRKESEADDDSDKLNARNERAR
jgi:hypothetical protein